ncbi:TatD family hydrolase [Lentisphaerota bacterium ZTH]|nr:TatD family hydrolase [Lentisphaerota bacterium]WET06048.1 TatD family hydrolase [Lentisphaerota bacterium ZTH]
MKLSPGDLKEIEYIDFHTHQNFKAPHYLNIVSCDPEDFLQRVNECDSSTLFSVGIHPWSLKGNYDQSMQRLEKLEKLLQHPQVIAIGETGLDKTRGPAAATQIVVFSEILKIAVRLSKPVIVHCVRFYPEIITLKKQFAPELPVMIHGYNGKPPLLEQLFKHNCMVSFGLAALNRQDVPDFLRANPKYFNLIALETDDSNVSVKSVYARAGEVLDLSDQELKAVMRRNFKRLFLPDDITTN